MKHVSHTVDDLDRLRSFLASDDIQTWADKASAVLIQIYSADTNSDWAQSLVATIIEQLPDAVIVGATTVGEVADGRTLTGKTVIGFSFFNTSTIRAFILPCTAGQEHETGVLLAQDLDTLGSDIVGVLLLATPLSIDAAAFLKGFDAGQCPYPIFGGGAGDYAAMEQSAIFYGSSILNAGVVAVAFTGDDLHIDSQTYLGWRPLSKEMTITEARDMVVKTVDGKPAFDLYSRYLGIPNDEDFFLNVLEFPFLLDRGPNPVARVPVAVDSDGGLQFVADIAEGETFRIGYGDPSLIITDANDIHNSARDFSSQAIFLYTCGCRRFLLQEDVELETLPFEAIAPTFGFYTYGEFFKDGENVQLLNSTMVAVSLREGNRPDHPTKAPRPKREDSDDDDPYANKHARIVSRLVHFVNAATTELEQANREITKLSTTDRLTGLHNRMKLDEVLEDVFHMAKRYDRSFSIILLDIDHFKQVNDTHGHLVGDDVLVRIARVLEGLVRDVDTLGRWGGEEFLLILPDTNLDQAQLVAEKLREAVADTELPVVGKKTSSFGVTVYCEDDTLKDILHRADEALYEAKTAGRNKVQVKEVN